MVRNLVSPAQATFIGVSNFRLLIPDSSDGLFDDFELIYTDRSLKPKHGLSPESTMNDFEYAASSLPRIGIMRMKSAQNEKMLWLFGNFGIRDQIPENAKTSQGLVEIFSPKSGAVSKKGAHILNAIGRNSSLIHWARMQHTPICFGDPESNILLLGDAAHGVVPTMGQGATLTIEDTCVASMVLINAIQNGTLGKECIKKIDEMRRQRRKYVSDISMQDSRHLMYQSRSNLEILSEQKEKWTNDSLGFRDELRSVWRDAPRITLASPRRAK